MSKLDPEAEIELSGTTQLLSGQLLTNQKIALVKEPDLGELLGGIIFGPATVLACFSDSPPAICQNASIVSSDGSGRFQFRFLGQDTQGSVGNASFFHASTTLSAKATQISGPTTYQRFQIQTEAMELPPMKIWQTELSVESNSDFLRVSPSGPLQTFDLRIETGPSWSTPVWEVENYDQGQLDARIFEDAEIVLSAVIHEQATVADVSVESTIRSGSYQGFGQAGAPPSRGAACSVSTRDGSMREFSPCPLSDGQLTTAYSPMEEDDCEGDACEESQANQVILLDLGEVSPAELLVIRLGGGECDIEISSDGVNWSLVAMSQADDSLIPLPVDTQLRYLRVTQANFRNSLLGLSEISVW